jgi:hypothetical protein
MRCPADGEKIPDRTGFFLQKMIAVAEIPLPEKQQTAETGPGFLLRIGKK